MAELRRLFKSIVALCTSTSEKLEDTRGEVRRLKAQHAEEAAARARLETRLASEVALRTQLEVKLKNTQEEVARLARAAGETVSEEYGGRGDEDVSGTNTRGADLVVAGHPGSYQPSHVVARRRGQG